MNIINGQGLDVRCSSRRRAARGFTLVELIIAIGLFSVVVSIAVGGFVSALRVQRQIASMLAAQSNMSLVLEQMAREIRTGYQFCHDISGTIICPTGSEPVFPELVFLNSSSQNVRYYLNGGAIVREVSGTSQILTSSKVSVEYIQFVLRGHLEQDGSPPRVTVSVGVRPKEAGVSEGVLNIQTTMSSRQFDT